MMRGFLDNYSKWLSGFKKRLSRWIIPLVEGGMSIKQIYEGLVNKLSTKSMLKSTVANPLKSAGINPSGNSLNLKSPRTDFFSSQEEERRAQTLESKLYGFKLTVSQVSYLKDTYYLQEIRDGVNMLSQWIDNMMVVKSPIAAIMAAIKKTSKEKIK